MQGITYIIIGVLIIIVSLVGTLTLEWILAKKKKQIREKTYQIYD